MAVASRDVAKPIASIERSPNTGGEPRSAGLPGWSAVIVVVLAVGTFVRLERWLDGRSLWLDEAALGLNVLGRAWHELLAPLDLLLVGPPAFLLLERLAVVLGGPDEQTLRFLPFVGGVLAPFVAWRLTSGLLRQRDVVLFVTLCAWSPLMLRYSDEAKPYGLEVMLALLVVLATRRVIEEPRNQWRWTALGALAVLSPTLSTSAPLVLPAVAVALLTVPGARSAARRSIDRAALVVILVMTSVIASLAFQSLDADHAFMREFWEGTFLRPGAPDLGARAWGGARTVLSGYLLGSLYAPRWGAWVARALEWQVVVALAVMPLGVWRLARGDGARDRRWLLALVAVPIALALFASAAGRYPLSARHLLFSAPSIFLLCVLGLEQVASLFPRRLTTAAWMLGAAGFVLPMGARLAMEMSSPIRRQHVRPLVERLARERQPGELVYVSAVAIPAWTYYTTDWRRPDRERLRWILERAGPDGPLFHSRLPLGPAIAGFGDRLVFVTDSMAEVYGLASGRVALARGFRDPLPDPGWADNEARRIDDLARGERGAGGAGSARGVWLLYVPLAEVDRQPAYGDLLRSLAVRGWTLEERATEREAHLLYGHMRRATAP
jgi:hypothetical protein